MNKKKLLGPTCLIIGVIAIIANIVNYLIGEPNIYGGFSAIGIVLILIGIVIIKSKEIKIKNIIKRNKKDGSWKKQFK